jgi:hypothetical protein
VRIRILREAEVDLIEGFNFYELQQAGLGNYFLDSLYSDVESLLISAGVHPIIFDHHRLLSKRFPFAVYYTVQSNLVSIHAVLDCRRNPAWIRKKLK